MTGTKRNYASSKPDRTTYGGLIFYSDFNTNGRGEEKKYSEIAKRITDDWKFDDKCRKLGENHKRKQLNKKGIK